jgi:hypothetical protein
VRDTHHVDQQVVLGYWNQALTTEPVEMQAWTDDRASRIHAPCPCSDGKPPAANDSTAFPAVASGIRCKSAGVVPGFMIRLGDGADNFGAVGGLAGGGGSWP